ncbi:MAG TPA: Addiction module component, CHP02574 [Planctomycetaceae bacterium]|nr:Addiction module component, CHP02574 [Planctomycetaceae bacterium]
MDTSTLQNLSNDEKLRLVFELWDALASNAPIQLSDAVWVEAQRRHRELIDNPHMAIDDDEMWRRVDG